MTYVAPEGSIPTMAVPSLDGVAELHLVGIGGSGMRNLARLLLARGMRVTGSDLKDSEALSTLEEAGAIVHIGHDSANLATPSAVVISSAIGPRNVEVVAAVERGIPVWTRAQAVGALATGHRTLAVAGTHGKTTTTAMLAVILDRAGVDPVCLVGGEVNEIGGGARPGSGDLFVVEADESDGSFLLLSPTVGIITNIELDHVDFYAGGITEIEAAFTAFAQGCGTIVACSDDARVRAIVSEVGRPAITYGLSGGADVLVTVASLGPEGVDGTVRIDGEDHTVRLAADGEHNLLDAAAAIVAAGLVGVPAAAAAAALAGFGGVRRRFEYRGSARGADFFDDYGHVPTELAVTLSTARRRRPGRVIALFQPHRYSRTQALWRELGESLSAADVVIVTDVYGAAQQPIPGVTGKLVVRGLAETQRRPRTVYLPHRADVIGFLRGETRSGDLIVTMGCGDVWMLGDAARDAVEAAP